MNAIDDLVKAGFDRWDATKLRRISMTLHRWHELECGDSNNYASWCLVRGRKENGEFVYDDAGAPYEERHPHTQNKPIYTRIPDRERGALKQLAKIAEKYPDWQPYIQGDPRGCALYLVRKDDIPAGVELDSCYTRGVAVYK